MAERVGGPEGLSDAERKVAEIIAQRKKESGELIEQGKSVREMLQHFDNDYSALEELYKEKTGGELLDNPYESAEHEVKITKSCSVVIPAYNNTERLENCLRAIQASSFNAKYPQQLEVIVIDDGSPRENIAENVKAMGFNDLNLKVARQSNGQVSKGRYSGVLMAQGDIVLITDPDVVYTPNTIEEYMKRQELLDNAVFFGLKGNIDTEDRRLSEQGVANGGLAELPQNLSQDGRVRDEGLSDSRWLKDGGHDKELPIDVDSDDYNWRAASMAWGFSICAKREDLLKTYAGYDERYRGYGGDDEDLTSRMIALGNYVIPNTGGICYHQNHPSGAEDYEGRRRNAEALEDNLTSPLKFQDVANPKQTDARTGFELKNTRREKKEFIPPVRPGLNELGAEEIKCGNYEKALKTLEKLPPEKAQEYWSRYDMAQAKIGTGDKGHVVEAIQILVKLIAENDNTWPRTMLGWAYGLLGDYKESDYQYSKALELDSGNEEAAIINADPMQNAEIGGRNCRGGKFRKALKYLDAALSKGNPAKMPWAIFDSGVAMEGIGQHVEALDRLLWSRKYLVNNSWVESRIGKVYQSLGRDDDAAYWFQSALELDPDNSEAKEGLSKIN